MVMSSRSIRVRWGLAVATDSEIGRFDGWRFIAHDIGDDVSRTAGHGPTERAMSRIQK